MSEKRFKYGRAFPINSDDSLPCITDRQDEKDYVRMSDLVDLLNEQQATIKQLESDKAIAEDYANIFEMENVKLRKKCGESDSENAKLRLKNKELQEEIKLLKPTNVEQYEQIVQLQEENEQLRQELEQLKKVK